MTRRWSVVWMPMVLAVGLASCQSSTSTTQEEVAPAATTTESSASVTTHIGKGFSSDSTQIAATATNFGPTENVYAVVSLDTPGTGTMRVRWVHMTADNAEHQVHEESIPMAEATTHYRFVLPAPGNGFEAGAYHLQVFVNDQPVAMERFEVGGNPAMP